MLAVVFRPAIARPRLRWPAVGSRSALFALVAVTTALRFVWAYWLEPSNDEAYHFLYTVYPDISQFDHPPLTMLLEQFGLGLFGSVSALALRIGFVLIGAGSTVLMALWTTRLTGDSRAGFWAAVALNATGFFVLKAGSFALPDGPLTFFALATLWALSEAFARPPSIRAWLVVGACWAFALASKYQAVFLPAGAVVFALLVPSARRHLFAPGPYLAVVVGLLGLVPTIVWNANHEWASFAYQGGRAVGFAFKPDKLGQYVGEQALVWFPWMWLVYLAAIVRGVRGWRSLADADRHLLVQALLPIGFFLVVATVRGSLAHWAWIGFLPLCPLVGRAWAAHEAEHPARMRRITIALLLATAAVILAVLLYVRSGWFPAAAKNPARDFSGWESVGRELRARGHFDRPRTFLFTEDWHASGHLAFEAAGRVPVLCFRSDDARGFATWSRPEDWLGYDGLFIDRKQPPGLVEHFARYFRSVELIDTFPMTRGGRPMLDVRVYLFREQIRPYPFRGHASRVE
jgi:4-amino-4-deoxy-L-arabinose transferase-like glycosyltransferase